MMKQGGMIDGLVDFIYGHELLVIAVVVGLAVIAYRKPKLMAKFAGGVAIIVAVVYVLSFLANLTSTGVSETTKLTDRPHVKVK
jgi:hypothetical protein